MHRRSLLAAAVSAAGLAALAGCGSNSTSSSSSGSSSPSINAGNGTFCQQAAAVAAQLGQLYGLAPTAGSGGNALTQLKTAMAADAAGIDALEGGGNVPGEIASDLHTLRTAIDQANTAVQSASTIQDITPVFASFQAPAVTAAITHLSSYGQTTCGFKASSSSSSSS